MEFSKTSKTNPTWLTAGESLSLSLSQYVASSSEISGSKCSHKQWSLSTDSYPICGLYKWMRLMPPLSRTRIWDLYSKWRQEGMVNGDWHSFFFFWQRAHFTASLAHGVRWAGELIEASVIPPIRWELLRRTNNASVAHISVICLAEISGREEQENGCSCAVWIYVFHFEALYQ